MKVSLVLLVVSSLTAGALLAACGRAPAPGSPASASSVDGSSGVTGIAVVDAGCPVLEGASTCPEVPLRARIVVVDATVVGTAGQSGPLATVESGPDGRFRIPLAPGRYELRGENLTGAPVPTAMPVPVTVAADAFIEVTVRFDSGVRGAPAGT